ncbi:MAG: insulinase family protein [Candidatus Dadabacteria bacterium]|nr:MAG: insulinase family protein [Candidatus Dadabacteria bacterium]
MLERGSNPESAPNTIALNRIRNAEPEISETNLLNGAKLISVVHPDAVQTSVGVIFDAGSRRENPGEHGQMHFFEHLPPGSFRITSGGTDLQRLSQARSWDSNIMVTKEMLSIALTGPDFDGEQMLSAVTAMLNPESDALKAIFDIEKTRIINEIIQRSCAQQEIRDALFSTLFMKDTGYDHPIGGTPQEVQGYTFEQVMEAGRRLLTPDNATFIVSGKPDFTGQVFKAFESASLPGSGPRPSGLPELRSNTTVDDLPQVNAAIAPPIPGLEVCAWLPGLNKGNSKEHLALEVATGLLSGHVSSELSHRQGVTYGAGAIPRQYPENGYVEIGFNTDPRNGPNIPALLAKTLEEFPATITPEKVAEYYSASRNYWYQNAQDITSFDVLAELARRPQSFVIPVSTKLEKLQEISAEDVRAAAEQFFNPEKLRLGYLGSPPALQAAGAVPNVTLPFA